MNPSCICPARPVPAERNVGNEVIKAGDPPKKQLHETRERIKACVQALSRAITHALRCNTTDSRQTRYTTLYVAPREAIVNRQGQLVRNAPTAADRDASGSTGQFVLIMAGVAAALGLLYLLVFA